jgi:hypothetical protein
MLVTLFHYGIDLALKAAIPQQFCSPRAWAFPRERLGVIVLTASVLMGCTHAGAAERTNVIIILADDLGYGDLGCYGHPHFKTARLVGRQS